MRWRTETWNEKCKRLGTWRKWFAWYPVMIDNEKVWLEWVYRRTKVYNGIDTLYETEYTDVMSILRKEDQLKEYDGLE